MDLNALLGDMDGFVEYRFNIFSNNNKFCIKLPASGQKKYHYLT